MKNFVRIFSVVAVLSITLVMFPSSSAFAGPNDFFPTDSNTLAIFEFNGNVNDSSGNNRHAVLINGSSTFVPSTFGQGLDLPDVNNQGQGIDWSAYKSLLVPPYTVEVLVYPETLSSWNRLFTQDTDDDNGLYYDDGSLVNYPDDSLDGVSLPVQTLHCLAWSAPVSPANVLNLYIDGQFLGQVGRTYNEPTVAHFFMDDTTDVPNENINGYADAMRISNVARTDTELAQACEASNNGTTLADVLGTQNSQPAPQDQVSDTTQTLPATGSTTSDLLVMSTLILMVGVVISIKARKRNKLIS